MNINQTYQIEFYQDSRGRCVVQEYLDSLSTKARAKITRWMNQLEIWGPNLPRPYADVVQRKTRELRVDFSPNHYRFLYFFDGRRIVITHGFVKNEGNVPQTEIDRSERMMFDYFRRTKKEEL
jgi:phage-related protein